MEAIDVFRKLRDVSGEVVEAIEKEDAEKAEAAMSEFMFLMMLFDALK